MFVDHEDTSENKKAADLKSSFSFNYNQTPKVFAISLMLLDFPLLVLGIKAGHEAVIYVHIANLINIRPGEAVGNLKQAMNANSRPAALAPTRLIATGVCLTLEYVG